MNTILHYSINIKVMFKNKNNVFCSLKQIKYNYNYTFSWFYAVIYLDP
jgi:hypothetical protein